MPVYDDTKRTQALKLATDIQAKLTTAANGVLAHPDLTLEEKLPVLQRFIQQMNWAQDLYNDLDRLFRPTAEAPEPEP